MNTAWRPDRAVKASTTWADHDAAQREAGVDLSLVFNIATRQVGGAGVVVDLARVNDSTADFVRDKDLEVIRPSDATAVTVEVFARWAYDRLAAALGDTGAEQLTVRIWESPVAYGGYRGPIRAS